MPSPAFFAVSALSSQQYLLRVLPCPRTGRWHRLFGEPAQTNQHTIILPDTNARHSTLASRAKWSHLREGCCPVHQHQYRLQTCHHGPHTHHTWFAPSSPPLLLPFSSHPLSPSPYLSAHGATSAGSRRLLHSVSFYPAPLALANPPFPAAVKHFSVT